jgi:hypothetical protein
MELTVEYLRSFRVFNIAMFDYIASILAFSLIFYLTGIQHSLRNYLLIIPIAIIAHLLVGQESTINTNLMNNELNGYKIFVISSIFFIIALSLD